MYLLAQMLLEGISTAIWKTGVENPAKLVVRRCNLWAYPSLQFLNTAEFDKSGIASFLEEVNKKKFPSKETVKKWSGWNLRMGERKESMNHWVGLTMLHAPYKLRNGPFYKKVLSDIREAWAKASDAQKRKYAWVGLSEHTIPVTVSGNIATDEIARKKVRARANYLARDAFSFITRRTSDWSTLYWCRDPKSGTGFSPCDTDVLAKLFRKGSNGDTIFVLGNEKHFPYSRLGISYKDRKARTVCKAEFYFHYMPCTTCCCVHGLVKADKSFALTGVNPDGLPLKDLGIQGSVVKFCADWYAFMEAIMTIIFTLFRTTQGFARKLNKQCM